MRPASTSRHSATAISVLTVLAAGTTTSTPTPRTPSPASIAQVTLILDSRSRSAGDADGAVEPGRVPRVAQARDLDHVAGVRRVHELAAADVDAHVAQPVEEHQVAGREITRADVDAGVPQRAGEVRQAAVAR